MIIIDGITYDVELIDLDRKMEFLDSSETGRLADYDLYRELGGVFYNYELKLGTSNHSADYDALWEKLSEPVNFHEVTVPYGSSGNYTFKAYFSSVQDKLMMQKNGKYYWKGLTVKYIAKRPARKP